MIFFPLKSVVIVKSIKYSFQLTCLIWLQIYSVFDLLRSMDNMRGRMMIGVGLVCLQHVSIKKQQPKNKQSRIICGSFELSPNLT